MKFSVEIDDILVQASETDAELRLKAEHIGLPKMLAAFGQRAAEEAWRTMEREIKKSKFLTLNRSDKSSFIRENAVKFRNEVSRKDRAELVETIFQQLVKKRDDVAT